jgi:oligopeptide/dipeptide ABC transporter ATP-binding protein
VSATPLLDVAHLQTSFTVGGRDVRAVRDVSFSLGEREVLGLIGESGSGKTVTGLSLLRLLPEHATVSAAAIRFKGRDLATMGDDELRSVRGVEMAMIFQDPVGSFNPAKTIAWHLRQAITRRVDAGGQGGAEWRDEAVRLLADVGIRAPDRVLGSFPHQLSGGMLQRTLIAMVIALHPVLIVADEPTTNLDNLVERQILELIRLHQRKLGASVLFITHDLVIAGEICDRIAVMYAGEIVEIGAASDVLERPSHPYSEGLLATSSSLERRDEYLHELPGEPGQRIPDQGCAFAPRCVRVMETCRTRSPELVETAPGHFARCLLHVR